MLNLVTTVISEEQLITQYDMHTDGKEGQGEIEQKEEQELSCLLLCPEKNIHSEP